MEGIGDARAARPGHGRPNPASIARAQEIQVILRERCSVSNNPELSDVNTIAGADAAYDGDNVCTGVVLMTFPEMADIQRVVISSRAPFPYIPGLFAFREGPGIIEAVENLQEKPMVLIVNGHGIAHPQRFGMASQIGVLLDIPVIGVTRRLMAGNFTFPGGQDSLIFPVCLGDEPVAMGIRNKAGSRPVFVSPGHKISLDQAVFITGMATRGHKMPEPLWRAHLLARTRAREQITEKE